MNVSIKILTIIMKRKQLKRNPNLLSLKIDKTNRYIDFFSQKIGGNAQNQKSFKL